MLCQQSRVAIVSGSPLPPKIDVFGQSLLISYDFLLLTMSSVNLIALKNIEKVLAVEANMS